MTESTSLQFAQSGQADTPEAGAGTNQAANTQAQTGTEPKYVTKAELDAAIAEVKRLSQSLTGKAENRIQKQMNELRAAGIQATTEQVQALVDNAERETAAQAQAQHSQAASAQAQQGTSKQDPLVTIAAGILTSAGIDPSTVDDDPDKGLIKTNAQTPEEFLASVRAFANRVNERKQSEGSPARLPNLTGGGGAHGGGEAAIVSEMENLLKHPSQNRQRIKELNTQLQKLKR